MRWIHPSETDFRRLILEKCSFWFGLIVAIGFTVRISLSSEQVPYLTAVINYGVALGLLTLSFVLKYKNNADVASITLIALLTTLGVNSCLSNGGMRAPISVIFVMLPVIGFLSSGRRAARFAFALSVLSLVFILVFEHYGLTRRVLDPDKYSYFKVFIYILCCVVTYVTGAIYDLMRVKNEKRLNEAIDELAAVKRDLEEAQVAAHIGSWHWDLEKNVMKWSRHLYDIFGLKPDIKPTFDLYLLRFGENEQDVMRNLLQKGKESQDYTFERTAKRLDGETINVLERVHLSVDKSTGQGRIYGTVQDITERRKSEEAINNQRATLAATAKMAALGEMAAGMAHEINNPVGIIYGKAKQLSLDLEAGSASQERIEKDLTSIINTTGRITKIISGLRAFSRNTVDDPLRREQLATIVKETLELCGERLRSHSIEISVNCDESIYVLCRSVQISQVIMNLISNARDAIFERDERWIYVTASQLGDLVTLEVVDSGHGIPDAVVAKMMQPFFTTKEVGKGTGLGLSISKGIMENQNGSLTYDPTSPHTRFVVTMQSAHRASNVG